MVKFMYTQSICVVSRFGYADLLNDFGEHEARLPVLPPVTFNIIVVVEPRVELIIVLPHPSFIGTRD